MSRQAIHRGTCQACGRIQKLPGARLSLHGYTKQWGFFRGTCRGSHHKPFEVSKDLIDQCIQGSMNAITSLQVQRDDLFQLPTPWTKAWYKVYPRGSGKYEWKLGTVTEQTHEYGTGPDKFVAREYLWTAEQSAQEIEQKRPPTAEKIMSYDLSNARSVTEAIAVLNRRYIHDVINVESDQLRDYIEWQQKRIKGWAPQPLLPLDDASEKRDAEAVAELKARGARLMPSMRGSKIMHGWWIGGSLLGRRAQQALAALKRQS